MKEIVQRKLFPVLMFAASFLAAMFVAACIAVATGCGSAAQRAVSAVAVAAVAADDLNATAYEIQSAEVVEDCQDSGGTFEGCWCPAMATPWERASRAECAIQALADAAVAGQAIIDADGQLGPSWFGVACAAGRAVEDAWAAAEDPPAALSTARGLVCGFADGGDPGPPHCEVAPVPPPCPEVTP